MSKDHISQVARNLFTCLLFFLLFPAGNVHGQQEEIDSLNGVLQLLEFEESHTTRKKLLDLYIQTNAPEKAEDLLLNSLEQCRDLNDDAGVLQYQLYRAVNQRLALNYDSAYSLLFDCLKGSSELQGWEHDSIVSQVYNLFGVFLHDKRQSLDALLYFKKSAMICEQQNKTTSFLAHVYNNLAVISLNLNRPDEGLYYCRMAEQHLQNPEGSLALVINHNKAGLHHLKEDCDSVYYYLNKGKSKLSDLNSDRYRLLVLGDKLYYSRECSGLEHPNTVHYKNLLRQELENPGIAEIAAANANTGLGMHFFEAGETDSSLLYYSRAYFIGKRNKLWLVQSQSAEMMFKIYHKREEFDSAVHYLGVSKAAQDSLNATTDLVKLREIERSLTLWEIDRVRAESRMTLAKQRMYKRLFQLLSGALFLILVLSTLLVRRKRKQNQALYERALLLAERNQIMEGELISNAIKQVSSEVEEVEEESKEPEELELSDEINDKIRHGIFDHLVRAQMFLNPNCNAAMLSSAIGTNRTYLNQYVKTQFGTTVSEYINDLRLYYVLELLKVDPSMRKFTIERMASDSGFNSKRTFERAFRARTGITPAFYIRQLEAESKE